jgi:hypothetical protein
VGEERANPDQVILAIELHLGQVFAGSQLARAEVRTAELTTRRVGVTDVKERTRK